MNQNEWTLRNKKNFEDFMYEDEQVKQPLIQHLQTGIQKRNESL